MKTNKLLPDLSIKKIWDRLTKHDSDVNTLQENINELDTDLQNQIDELNSKRDELEYKVLVLENRNSRKIVDGNIKNCMIVATEYSFLFSGGAATLDVSSIAGAYDASALHAWAVMNNASSTVITSVSVANNIVTVKARSLETDSGYTGAIVCTVYLILG